MTGDSASSAPALAAACRGSAAAQSARALESDSRTELGTEPAGAAKVFDRPEFMARMGLDEQTCDHFVGLFLREGLSQVEQLGQAVDEGNAEALERLGHTLKGASEIFCISSWAKPQDVHL